MFWCFCINLNVNAVCVNIDGGITAKRKASRLADWLVVGYYYLASGYVRQDNLKKTLHFSIITIII